MGEGEIDPVYGVKRVVLTPEDVCDKFDCPYHRFIQGGIAHNGRIYSTEGFENDLVNRPAIRVIDLKARREKQYVDLMDVGYKMEPEMIDFHGESCYYSDAVGNLYRIEF